MPFSQSFLFIRHGETDWNRANRLQGHTDIPLNQTGMEQAMQAAEQLVAGQRSGRVIDMIVSSPMQRALKTAEIISERLALPIHTDAGLMERCFGVYEGASQQDVPEQYRVQDDLWATQMPEGAESHRVLYDRAAQAMHGWIDTHADKTILFVSHGAVFSVLHYALLNKYIKSGNATPFHFYKSDTAWRCDLIGA